MRAHTLVLIAATSLVASCALVLHDESHRGNWQLIHDGKQCSGGDVVSDTYIAEVSLQECYNRATLAVSCPYMNAINVALITGVPALKYDCWCELSCPTLVDNYGFSVHRYTTAGAGAVADPHMRNVVGETFALRKSGMHTFLNIPRGAHADDALLHVEAKVLGEKPKVCSVFFIKRISIAGTWLGDVPPLTFAVAEETEDQRAAGLRIGNSTFLTCDDFATRVPSSLVKVELQSRDTATPVAVNKHATSMTAKFQFPSNVRLSVSWVSERISDSHVAQSLWLTTSGMESLNMPIGGLLGTADHTTASETDAACQEPA